MCCIPLKCYCYVCIEIKWLYLLMSQAQYGELSACVTENSLSALFFASSRNIALRDTSYMCFIVALAPLERSVCLITLKVEGNM